MSEYDPSYDDTSHDATDYHADPVLEHGLGDTGIGAAFGGEGYHEPGGYEPGHEPGGYEPGHDSGNEYDPSNGHEPGGVVGPTGSDTYDYGADHGDSSHAAADAGAHADSSDNRPLAYGADGQHAPDSSDNRGTAAGSTDSLSNV
jgi:hypothetical protein